MTAMRPTLTVSAQPGRSVRTAITCLTSGATVPASRTLVKQVYALKQKWKAKLVIVENKASGISLIEVINQKGQQPWLIWLGPEKGKVERAQQQTVKFERGCVWLPTGALAGAL